MDEKLSDKVVEYFRLLRSSVCGGLISSVKELIDREDENATIATDLSSIFDTLKRKLRQSPDCGIFNTIL